MKTYELPKVRTNKGLEEFDLKDVELVDDNSIRGAENEMRCVEYKKIGSFAKGSSIFKYMNFDAALKSLNSGKLRFAEPSTWDDQYESRFYLADYKNVLNGQKEEDVCPLLYASCFTNKKDNEPAWKIYTYAKDKNDIVKSRCVQFKLDKKKLRGELIKNLSNCCVYEGCVSYFWQGFIDSMHRKSIKGGGVIKLHSLFFNDFDFIKYLNLLLLKRDSFEHEREIRILIVSEEDKHEKKAQDYKDNNGNVKHGRYIDVQINWSKVIKEVIYDASCSKEQKQDLINAMKKVNNNIIVKPYYVNGRKSRITIEGI